MTKPDKRQQEENRPPRMIEDQPKKRRGRPAKFLKIDDTPENVARALWGERSTKFPKNQGNQTLSGA